MLQSGFRVKFALAAKYNIPVMFPNLTSIWRLTCAQRTLFVAHMSFEAERDEEREATRKTGPKPVSAADLKKLGSKSEKKLFGMKELEALGKRTK